MVNPKDFTWPVVILASVVIVVSGGLLWAGRDTAVAGSLLTGVVVGLFTHAAGVSSQSQTLDTATRILQAASASMQTTSTSTAGSEASNAAVTSIGGDK